MSPYYRIDTNKNEKTNAKTKKKKGRKEKPKYFCN